MDVRIDIEIETWPITRLIPRITNPRTHTPQQVAQVAASMKEFGWTNPILVGADNDVLAGHARLLAARQLGMAEVPVIHSGISLKHSGARWSSPTTSLRLAARRGTRRR